MKLSECIDEYIENNKAYLKVTTIRGYEQRKRSLLNIFGDVDINTLTQECLQNYINKCQKENGTTRKALRARLSLIITALKPYMQFRPFKYITVEKDAQNKEIYSESDIKKISDYISSHPNKKYIPIMIAIYVGLRVCEILGLKWSDIDFDNRIIHIRRNATRLDGENIISTTKTKNGIRDVCIVQNLYDFLYAYKRNDDSFVCVTRNGNLNTKRGIQRLNQTLCEKLNVPRCGMHAYRHCFASRLLKESTDFKTISTIMGHSNIGITQNIYNHTTEERQLSLMRNAFSEKEEQPISLPPVVDYSERFDTLQTQIDKLYAIIQDLTQTIQQMNNNSPKCNQKPKYKIVDNFNHEKLCLNKKDVCQQLDISTQELTRHLNGFDTVLDELEIYVEEIK